MLRIGIFIPKPRKDAVTSDRGFFCLKLDNSWSDDSPITQTPIAHESNMG